MTTQRQRDGSVQVFVRVCELKPLLFVDLVPEAHRVYDGELEVDITLLQVIGSRPQVYTILIVTGFFILEHRVEKGVHQRGLADTSLP